MWYTRRAAVVDSAVVKNFPIHTVLQVIQLVTGVLLVLGVLMQTPKSNSGLGGTIGGGGGDGGGGYRTKRGIEKTLFQITIGLTLVFVLVSVANIKFA
jgi:preprotein translocase subunit SecG